MRKRAWLVSVVVLALVAAGCAKSSASGGTSPSTTTASATTSKPVYGGILNIGLDAETDGWNPVSSEWAAAGYYVAQTIFDPLCAYDAAGQARPYLAQSVSHNSSYTVWTINLRPGIKFSNGQPLNAAAVVLQLTLAKASPLVGQALGPMRDAVAVNDLTVKVNMTQPWVAFESVLATQPGFMAAPAQLEAKGAASTDQPIGTGPFVFQQWIRDSTLTVTRNPHYWRTGLPYVDKIVFHVITDPTTRLQALESDQLQFMYATQASQVKEFLTNHSENEIEQFIQQPTFIMLNTDAPPLDSLDVRLALEYATNQQEINDTIALGIGTVATEPYAPGSPWYVPSGYPTSPDISKAKSLIAAYEKSKGISGPVKFTLGCTNAGTNPEAMQLVQAQWEQIGVDVTLSYTEQATYINNAIFGDFQANCWTQFGSIDPDLDATWWLSANAHPIGQVALNFVRLSDSVIDHALEVGRTDPNYETRKQAYGQVWHQFAIEAPYIWLGRAPDGLLFSSNLHGLGEATFPDGTKQLAVEHDSVDVPITQLWLSS